MKRPEYDQRIAERRASIRARLAEGIPAKVVAHEHGVSLVFVYRIGKAAMAEAKARRDAVILQLRARGWTFRQIGAHVGTGHGTAGRVVRRNLVNPSLTPNVTPATKD